MMTSHRNTILSIVAILAFHAVAVGGQTRKSVAPAKQKSLPTLSAQEIFKRASPSVMVVESLDAEGKVTKLGSGVVIAPGSIITNRHVIEDGVGFRVEHNGRKWPAKLIKVDPDHDLAELSVAGLYAPAVTVLDSSKLAVGETAYAIGSPEGLELTISEGLISGLREFDKGRVIQTSAAISPGSSGGGLFDAQGRLVGITTFYLKEGQSLNFALPAEWTLALNHQPIEPSPAVNQDSSEFQALVWFETGYEAGRASKYEQAVSAEQEAIRLKPDFAEAWANLGAAYGHLGRYDKEVSAEQEATRLKPDDVLAWYNLGVAYDDLGQYNKAVSAEQEAIRLKPDFAEVWVNLGIIYEQLGQHDKEVRAEQEAIRLKPDLAEAWVNLGVAYDNLEQWDKAVNAEQEAIRLKPNSLAARVNLGDIYGKQQRYDKEAEVSRETLRLQPDLVEAWANLGEAYNGLRLFGQAATAEREAIRLRPGFAEAWYALGLAYYALGQRSEVIVVYKRLKTLDARLADKFFKAAVLP